MTSRYLFLSLLLVSVNLVGMEKTITRQPPASILSLPTDVYKEIFKKLIDHFKIHRRLPGYESEDILATPIIRRCMASELEVPEILKLCIVCKKFNAMLRNPDFIGELIKYACDDLYFRRELAVLKQRKEAVARGESYIPYNPPDSESSCMGSIRDTSQGVEVCIETYEAGSMVAEANGREFDQLNLMYADIAECLESHATATRTLQLVSKAYLLRALAKTWITNFLKDNPRRIECLVASWALLFCLGPRVTRSHLQFFQEIGIPLSERNIDGMTPLIMLAAGGFEDRQDLNALIEPFKFLIEHGADINAQDTGGKTALLHLLSRGSADDGYERYELALFLITSYPQLNVFIKEAEQKSALDYVRYFAENTSEICLLLESMYREKGGLPSALNAVKL